MTAAASPTSRVQAPGALRAAVDGLERAQVLDRAGDVLQPVAAKLGAGPAGDVLRGEWLGHALHPLLTDVPLGCWIGAGLLDVLGGRSGRRAARRLVGLGLLATPVTVASGLADWAEVTEPGARRVGVVHALGNTVVAVLYAASWRARRREHHVVGVAAALAGGALAVGTGYLGGHLSFARSVGVGPRGLGEDGDAYLDLTESDLLDAAAVMALLGIEREQLDAMVADDLLVVRTVRDAQPLFARSDVVAVRLIGG
jgi:uncharacterized membrane protein